MWLERASCKDAEIKLDTRHARRAMNALLKASLGIDSVQRWNLMRFVCNKTYKT